MLFDKDNSKKETATSVSRLALACADAVLFCMFLCFLGGEGTRGNTHGEFSSSSNKFL